MTEEEPAGAAAAPPGEVSSPATEPRRRRVVLLTVALVAVLVLGVMLVVKLTGGPSDSEGSAQPYSTGGADGVGAVPTPPSSAPGQGTYIESTVGADGTVSVRQWIRSSTQIRTLDVSVSDPVQTATAAHAVDVVVQALNGSVLAKSSSVGNDRVTLKLGAGVPNLYVSYRIMDAADDASQTVASRMLVTVLGMDVDYSGSNGVTQREVSGPGSVSNVACLRVNDSPSTAPRPCGAPTDDNGWLVTLRGIDRSDRLIAQLEAGS